MISKNLRLPLLISLVLSALLGACSTDDVDVSDSIPASDSPPALLADGTEAPGPNSSPIFTWESIPTTYELLQAQPFTLPSGATHWYQVVYLPDGGVNWVQARALAEQRGGYLVSFHSQEENDFAFSLVTDEKYWWKFDHGSLDDGTPLYNLSGPFIGGFQPDGSPQPDGGWRWASGEPMSWINWQKEGLDIGIHIAPDNQPNNNNGNQNVMAFGEVDEVASYWSDVPHLKGTYGTTLPQAFGFIIEYVAQP